MQLRRALPLLAACATVALTGCGGDELRVDPTVRAATFRFADTVAPGDREWILGAVDNARPEARQLIDDVDGMVTIDTFREPAGRAVGVMQPVAAGEYRVSFNLAYLDGERKLDRDTTVVHELGHVVDHALVPVELRDELAAALPTTGACYSGDTGDCTAPAERFADTFAKWALRGAVSAVGAGYSVATPASLEDWGAPLSSLAIDVAVASR
jgi:hypothetical protein